MSTLIVTAHPDTDSLTHQSARLLQGLLRPDGASFAHLAQEQFDPRFTAEDRRAYATRIEPDSSVVAEQRRLDGVEHVVLVFPVYWWSMPALLKGWIDRVFISGWAFDYDDKDRLVPQLGRLTVHLMPVAGTTEDAFVRHGHLESLGTQIQHGIIDFCGMQRGATAFVWDSESGSEDEVSRSFTDAATTIASAIRADVR
jgi:NAD(P)H dehydrogenase (quinone)